MNTARRGGESPQAPTAATAAYIIVESMTAADPGENLSSEPPLTHGVQKEMWWVGPDVGLY